LTGVANRRHLDAVLQAEWQRALRQGHLLALAMIDLDHFKRFNDHYGHLAGDQCLRQVASVLAGHAKRSGELVARYGGEEFAVILPGLGPEQAMEWAEDLRSRVAELQIAHQDSDQGVVTISCGVVAMVPTGERVAVDLIRLADQALYRAKSAGRNRVAASAA
jgi:diguanylate cyclase (GGDEF)-like protein